MQKVYHSNATTDIHIRQQLQAAVSCTMASPHKRFRSGKAVILQTMPPVRLKALLMP